MPIPLRVSTEDHIANEMVAALQADTELASHAEIHIEKPTVLQRSTKEGEPQYMEPDHLYLDVYPIGIAQRFRNHRADEYEYETHLMVRAQPDTRGGTAISEEWIATQRWYRDHAQGVFSVQGVYRMDLPDGCRVHRNESEPFVINSATQLYGAGLFVAPIQVTWKAIRR